MRLVDSLIVAGLAVYVLFLAFGALNEILQPVH
jgi:hypothetical protein